MKRPLPWFVAIGCAGAAIVALCWGWQMRCERNEAWRQQNLATKKAMELIDEIKVAKWRDGK